MNIPMALDFSSMIILHSLSVFPLRLILQTYLNRKKLPFKERSAEKHQFLCFIFRHGKIIPSSIFFILSVLIVENHIGYTMLKFYIFFYDFKSILFVMVNTYLKLCYVNMEIRECTGDFFPKQFVVAWIQVFKSLS